MHFGFSLHTSATPTQVLAALTDFTERRTHIWSDSLDPEKYQVRELGETWAVVREGTAHPSVWAIERYDWSQPGRVSWAAVGSNFCRSGSGVEVTIAADENGGSLVTGEWRRTPFGIKGEMVVALNRAIGPKAMPKLWTQAFNRYAATQSVAV